MEKKKVWSLVLIAVFALVLFSFGCAKHGHSSSKKDDGGGGTVDPNAFQFQPSSAYVNTGDTVHFSLINGTPPFQFGYVTAADIQSYSDPAQIVATFDSNTGVGSYTVGPNNDCTDKLAAQDATGAICYFTVFVGTGGGSGGSGGGSGGGSSGGSETPSATAEAATDPGEDAISTVRERLICASPRDMFDYVNYTRQQYSFHQRNYGYPFSSATSGGGWSTTFSWSDQLAGTAQEEAERLAAGGSPRGRGISHSYGGERFWMDAIETSHPRVSGKSDPKYKTDTCSHPLKWHSTSNSNYRQGIAYQGGTGPYVNKLGVGMAVCSDGKCVWWVLQFGN